MPYTPPSLHSPVASKPQSPTLSRSQSYVNGHAHPASTARPGLPRSASSTSYLHKHRRSPTFSKQTVNAAGPATPDTTPDNGDACETSKSTPTGSIHQSPPPQNDSLIPTGAVISPPDSPSNSSDDEEALKRGRVRKLANLAELQAAIRNIDLHRASSPNRGSENTREPHLSLGLDGPQPERSSRDLEVSARLPLSQEARKIAHSRSHTEYAPIVEPSAGSAASPGRSRSVSESEADDPDYNEDDDMFIKPPMVRKKSGELVRPALRPSMSKRRPSSMPGTPTYSKAVHFDSHLEHVRHFLQVDRPLAVSAGSSPVDPYESEIEFPFGEETPKSRAPPFEWAVRLNNFPRETIERQARAIRVEKVCLSPDNKHLVGTVAVANIAFHKLVVARFTLDYWKTTSEVVAEYSDDVRRKQANDGCDRFSFSVRLEDLANLEVKTMFFCVRYNVNGQEFWDSNENMNFQVDFSKKAKPQNGKQGKQGMQGLGARPLNSLPRSTRPSQAASSGRPRSMASFDDFSDGFGQGYDFKPFPPPASKSALRFKGTETEHAILPDAPGRKTNTSGQAFGNRYDFGASLSAAIQAAGVPPSSAPPKQLQFAHRSGSQSSSQPTVSSSPADVSASTDKKGSPKGSALKISTTNDSTKPAALTSEKPSLQSSSYHELLDKYCFFGSAKVSSPTVAKQRGNGSFDGATDITCDSDNHVAEPSGSQMTKAASPPEEARSPTPNTPPSRMSRSHSPATGTAMSQQAVSPGAFGYPYRTPAQNSFFSETCAPTAIRG